MAKPKPTTTTRRAKRQVISGGTTVGGVGGMGRAVLSEHATAAGQMLLAQTGRAMNVALARPKTRKKPR